ncbi:hypothetical protein FOL47_000705, partial [Perkinsus chesapeaki]
MPMYHLRDWKARLERVIPKINGITTAYFFRLERDETTSDVLLYYKRTMADTKWEPPQETSLRFLPLLLLSTNIRWLSDVEHSIELQLGTYKYLPHEALLEELPVFEHRKATRIPSEIRAPKQSDTRKADSGRRSRFSGSKLIGNSLSNNPEERAIWNAMKGKELKYSGPAQISIRSDRGSAKTASSPTLGELPRADTYAFINAEGGLDSALAPDCPAIAKIDPSTINSSKKKYARSRAPGRVWMATIPMDTLVAWNIDLTARRTLPQHAITFLKDHLQ